jgi:acyl dehydratase
MPLNRSFLGRSFPPTEPFEVGREHIRAFAQAIGDDNPVYSQLDAAAAAGHRDLVAPPTFLTVLTFRRPPAAITDPELGLDYSRVVHGEERYVLHRPVYAGDRLVATRTITDMRDAGRNELMTTTTEVTTVDGEHVATGVGTLIVRGTAGAAKGA